MRLRLGVAYDGTDFCGWAVQPGLRSVAGELTAGLVRLFGEPAGLTVAGRTDAGVHATGQVCHVDVPEEAWQAVSTPRDGASSPMVAIRRLAGVLPGDVRVTSVARVDERFDARFSAYRRRYRYRITDNPAGPLPLRRYDTLAWPRALDTGAMTDAAWDLVGEHDFAAYCRRRPNATTIRELQRLDVDRRIGGMIVVSVEADAFCHAMVRSLVGALLAVGDGRRDSPWPASLLSRTERASEVTVAPAHGLTLIGVDYPADLDECAARSVATRRRRDEA